MARTLWGNILEMMAAAGINTAAQTGAKVLAEPFAAKRQASQQVLEALLPAMGTETDPNKLSAIASKIKDISGVDLATGPATNPAGYEGSMGGSAVTIPKSTPLESIAPGLTTTPGFIRPVPKLENMRASLFSKLPPEEQKTAAFPKDATLQAARENLLANLAFRGQEGEANRASREEIAKGNQDTRTMIAGIAQQGAQQHRDFMHSYLIDKLEEAKRRGATMDETKELSQFTSIQNQIGLAQGEQKKALQVQLNKMIDMTKNPILQSFPKYTEDVPVEGSGYNLPLVGEVGRKTTKVPVGTSTVEAKPAVTIQVSPAEQELQRRGYHKDTSGQWVK